MTTIALTTTMESRVNSLTDQQLIDEYIDGMKVKNWEFCDTFGFDCPNSIWIGTKEFLCCNEKSSEFLTRYRALPLSMFIDGHCMFNISYDGTNFILALDVPHEPQCGISDELCEDEIKTFLSHALRYNVELYPNWEL